jgi:hypothetical protein
MTLLAIILVIPGESRNPELVRHSAPIHRKKRVKAFGSDPTGSQEVTGSIPVSSTNLNGLARPACIEHFTVSVFLSV